MIRASLIRPASRLAAWLASRFWRIVRPTLFEIYSANRRISKVSELDVDSEEADWHTKLQDLMPDERALTVSTLWSVYESDQNRIRGIESKALGVLQIASLVFAGDVAALTLALRQGAWHPKLAIWLVAVSCVYLGMALVASVSVAKPCPRYMLKPADVLPPELVGARLAMATLLNEPTSIARSNLTTSAIFDVLRALIAVAAALVAAIPASSGLGW